MLESVIQSKILRYLNSRENVWAVKVISANKIGTPDILVCYKGKFIALECKNENGSTSKLQEYQIKKIKNAGGLAYVVRDIKQVMDILDEN